MTPAPTLSSTPDLAGTGSATGASRSRSAEPGFVVSRSFDLAYFLLPAFGSAAFIAGQWAVPSAAFALCALVWVGLAQSHFGATALFYFSRSNRDHYRLRPLVYFVVPLMLIMSYVVVGLTRWAGVALALVPIASFWHGNRQSFGICGLYRARAGMTGRSSRHLELLTIFAGGACFTAAGAIRLGMFPLPVGWNDLPPLLLTLWWTALTIAFVLLVIAQVRAWRESRTAGLPPWPRAWALTAAWAMYLPYVLASDPVSAFLASLIPHYAQYHGLLFLLNRNRVLAGEVDPADAIRWVVRSPATYWTTTIGFAVALGASVVALDQLGRRDLGMCLVAGVNVAHFWLDGFFWRMRDPYVRQSTLRFVR